MSTFPILQSTASPQGWHYPVLLSKHTQVEHFFRTLKCLKLLICLHLILCGRAAIAPGVYTLSHMWRIIVQAATLCLLFCRSWEAGRTHGIRTQPARLTTIQWHFRAVRQHFQLCFVVIWQGSGCLFVYFTLFPVYAFRKGGMTCHMMEWRQNSPGHNRNILPFCLTDKSLRSSSHTGNTKQACLKSHSTLLGGCERQCYTF